MINSGIIRRNQVILSNTARSGTIAGEGELTTIQHGYSCFAMNNEEYLEKRKELVSGQARKRSSVYPLLMGVFVVMILINMVMLAINNT